MTSRWSKLVHCDECGVDAGERCMTPDQEKADDPCPGRGRLPKKRPGPTGPRSHCLRGHAMDAANAVVRPNGMRECKQCRKDRERAAVTAKRAAVSATALRNAVATLERATNALRQLIELEIKRAATKPEHP